MSLGDDLFSKLKINGIDGLIIVDLPYEESSMFLKKLNRENVDLIRLISPTTTQERINKIISTSSGYLYYISLKGVTGSNISISSDLDERIKNIKGKSELPIVVGFGIKDSDTANKMASISDGVVVGSKLVEEISKLDGSDETRLKDNLKSIIKDLKSSIK
jgi:tryptophan synthase alpha chain